MGAIKFITAMLIIVGIYVFLEMFVLAYKRRKITQKPNKMKTKILQSKDQTELFLSLQFYLSNTEIAIVSIQQFYDKYDENHKAIIAYYE